MALAFVAAALMFVFPVAWFYGSEHTIAFYIYSLREYLPGAPSVKGDLYLLPVLLLTAAMALVPVFAIFQFKKLMLQYVLMRFVMFAAILDVAGLLLFYINDIGQLTQAEPSYELGAFMPLIVIILAFLSMRAIKSDVRLLRSVDRIR